MGLGLPVAILEAWLTPAPISMQHASTALQDAQTFGMQTPYSIEPPKSPILDMDGNPIERIVWALDVPYGFSRGDSRYCSCCGGGNPRTNVVVTTSGFYSMLHFR